MRLRVNLRIESENWQSNSALQNAIFHMRQRRKFSQIFHQENLASRSSSRQPIHGDASATASSRVIEMNPFVISILSSGKWAVIQRFDGVDTKTAYVMCAPLMSQI